MSTLAEIEQAAVKLPQRQKKELMLFLGAQLRAANCDPKPQLTPNERAADLQRWAASHERGPGLSDPAVGRDGIYD
jgi:hypothetical protein